MVRRIFVTLIFALGLAASATPGNHRPAQNLANLLVQTDWLAAHLSDRNLVILHVGADRTSYDAGHIPGARFLALSEIVNPRGSIANQLAPVNDLKSSFERLGVGDRSRVILYGDMLGLLAARAYFTLDYLGHGTNAALLDGGLEKWSREHGTVRTIPENVLAATLTVRLRPDVLVELPALRQLVSSKTAVLIDARPPADYSGATIDRGIPRPGHIPGAKNVFWADMLVSKDNPALKSTAEIRARYAAAGLDPGSRVIVYCRGGIQAAHDYFTLKLVGFRPVLYDGSFLDWSNAFDVPVEVGAGG
jgi:thiosulfate/3-mercaptopyruvate sulfurtransferase